MALKGRRDDNKGGRTASRAAAEDGGKKQFSVGKRALLYIGKMGLARALVYTLQCIAVCGGDVHV